MPYYTEYDESQVKTILERWLASKYLDYDYSPKRKGYIIKCPHADNHTHRARRDDCCLFTTPGSNGFVFISIRCRHDSCWDGNKAYCRELNKEWGRYLNHNYIR